jgi:hypothetical protein
MDLSTALQKDTTETPSVELPYIALRSRNIHVFENIGIIIGALPGRSLNIHPQNSNGFCVLWFTIIKAIVAISCAADLSKLINNYSLALYFVIQEYMLSKH